MIMDEYFFLYLLISLVLLGILYSFQKNFLVYLEKSRKNEYYIKKAKINREFEEESEPEENKNEIPRWLTPILQGAGLDVDALAQGDISEINKAKAIVDKLKLGGVGGIEY